MEVVIGEGQSQFSRGRVAAMTSGGDPVLEERIARLRGLLARDADDPLGWFSLGRALLELGRHEEAREPLRRAISLDPTYTAAQRDLARALLASGEAAEAARVLETGIPAAEAAGDLQTAREMRVFLRRARAAQGLATAREEAPRAVRALAESAAGGSSEAHALYRRGFDHFANGRCEEAIALFREAIAKDPRLAIAWNGMSLAFRQQGRIDEAIEAGRRLILLEPEDALSHTNLSILYQRKGMIAEAEEEKAIAMQLQMRKARS
jgi:protein O-GlcNAc transferase